MKKLKLLVMPLMVVSLLMSCGEDGPKKPITTYNVIFYAGKGSYSSGNTICVNALPGTKLLSLLKDLETPVLDDNTFAYYEYLSRDGVIDYDDVVDSNIILKANYYLSTIDPTDDLTDFDWKTIKNISVTGDPSRWFNIGATKKVKVNEKDHLVRIIGFDHDKNPEGNDLGITFEFANVVTNSNGSAVSTKWNYKQEAESQNCDYRESTLNDLLNNSEDDGSVINMLPSSDDPDNPDLRDVIQQVNKKVGVNKRKTDDPQHYIATGFDGDSHPYPYLFPLAHDELCDHEDFVTQGEGSIYQYYSLGTSDLAKTIVGGYKIDYWLRSPYVHIGGNDYAWDIADTGFPSSNMVWTSTFAVAPAFCI